MHAAAVVVDDANLEILGECSPQGFAAFGL